MKTLRTIAFSCLFGGCSLVYGTGDLAHDAGASDAAIDAQSDAGPLPSDAAMDARSDASPPPADASPPPADADPPPADAGPGCTVEIERISGGWPMILTLNFRGCPAQATVQEPSGREIENVPTSAGEYVLQTRVPLFGERRLRVLVGVDREVGSIELPVSVEELASIQGVTSPFEMAPVPQMDVDDNGNAVFITSAPEVADGEVGERGAVVYWARGPGVTSAIPLVAVEDHQFAAPSISDIGGFVLFADRTSPPSYQLVNVANPGERFTLTGAAPDSGVGHTDILRATGTSLSLLVHDGGQNYTQTVNLTMDTGETLTSVGPAGAGPGLLGGMGTASYVAEGAPTISGSMTGTANAERSLVANDGVRLVYVGSDGSANGLVVGPRTLSLPLQFGLASASDNLTTVLLRNSASHVFNVALIDSAGAEETRRLHIDADGADVDPIGPSSFNSAAISPNGQWAVFAFSAGGAEGGMARLRVQ